MSKMNYHKITKHDIANGTGVRVVLWLSGCSHHCKGCHNPQTWDKNNGKLFDIISKQELFEALNKPYIDGLTLSGGDPLYNDNLNEVYRLLIETKNNFPNKTIWLYTGYTWEEILYPIITDELNCTRDNQLELRWKIVSLCDVIVDGEFKEEFKNISLKFRGSNNQRIIDVQKSLTKKNVILRMN